MSQKAQETFEASVVERMSQAKSLADKFFGAQSDTYAVEAIADYLEVADDEEEFTEDLTRIIEHTKVIYSTDAPTPEQVFGVFDRVFETEEK